MTGSETMNLWASSLLSVALVSLVPLLGLLLAGRKKGRIEAPCLTW